MNLPEKTLLQPEVDEVSSYIFRHYLRLLTAQEYRTYLIVLSQAKLEHDPESRVAAFALKRNLAASPDRQPLLQDGTTAFYHKVRDRILHEHADAVFLNHCPKCNTLCRTPRACLCPNPGCQNTWFEKRESRERTPWRIMKDRSTLGMFRLRASESLA
jgi:hypothetical protein